MFWTTQVCYLKRQISFSVSCGVTPNRVIFYGIGLECHALRSCLYFDIAVVSLRIFSSGTLAEMIDVLDNLWFLFDVSCGVTPNVTNY